MEQHQVPRNISGFQFKLIGDMTIRQFIYVAAGSLIAFFIFKANPIHPYFSIGLALSVGFVGFALAFMPIQERPLDQWIILFIKSIISPTQYIWTKEGKNFDYIMLPTRNQMTTINNKRNEDHEVTKRKLHEYLTSLPANPHDILNAQEENYVKSTITLFSKTNLPIATQKPSSQQGDYLKTGIKLTSQTGILTNPANINTQDQKWPIEKQTKDQKEKMLDNFVPSVINITQKMPPPASQSVNTISAPSYPNENKKPFFDQLDKITKEKEALAKQLMMLQKQMEEINFTNFKSNVIKPAESEFHSKAEPTIKLVPSKAAIEEIGIPNLPTIPNIITGIIKDPQKRQLPNIILTIKDASNNPLRALKTNKLGQFASATPLPNGTFYIQFEDPMKKYHFDTAEVTLNGKTFMPIEITAKGEKEALRAQLSKEIFGQFNAI